jgi:DNA-directed RNA polymerase subunit F
LTGIGTNVVQSSPVLRKFSYALRSNPYDTLLSPEMRNDLNRSSCSAERSEERVKRLYASLMPEQRKDLRIAFKKNGYEINAMLC